MESATQIGVIGREETDDSERIEMLKRIIQELEGK
jgi:hypothetical protein